MTGDEVMLAGLIFAAAALYSSVGHAGASGYLAAMALFGLAPDVMRPTALALNVLVGALAFYRYSRAGLGDLRLLLPFVIGSVPAAFVGGLIKLPPEYYRPLLGVILLLSAAQFLRTARRAPIDDTTVQPPNPLIAVGCGAGLGLLSGLSGTGGGIFLSPLMLLNGWAATRTASGVAAGFILANSLAGLAGTTFSLGTLPAALPVWALAALAGGVVGTQAGLRALPVPGLRVALAGVLLIAAAKMLLS